MSMGYVMEIAASTTVRERRSLERFDLALSAKIETLKTKGAREKSVQHLVTGNICSGGVYFPTNQALAEGEAVGMSILLATDRFRKLGAEDAVVYVKGKVLRIDPTGMAIRFSGGYEIVKVGD